MVSGRMFGKTRQGNACFFGSPALTFMGQKRKELFQDNDLETKTTSETQEMINPYWFNAMNEVMPGLATGRKNQVLLHGALVQKIYSQVGC